MITSNYNTELQLLEVSYSGSISMKDLVEFGNQIYGNKKLPRKLCILTDVSRAQYKISTAELSELMSHIEQHLLAFEYIKAAFVQSKPRETDYSMLLSSENTIQNYFRAIFSTREAALEWLMP